MTTFHNQFVFLKFDINGKHIPLDHGYSLFSAIKHRIPMISQNEKIIIHPIKGKSLIKEKVIEINSYSKLVIVCPADYVDEFIKNLYEEKIELYNKRIVIGNANISEIRYKPILKSEIVVIDNVFDGDKFKSSLEEMFKNKNYDNLDIKIPKIHDNYSFRKRSIKGKNQIGFPVIISEINEKDSIRLQRHGIGKHKHCGCGCFK